MKNTFRALLVFLLTYTQAFGAGPVIWNGTRSKALTSKGFVLSDTSIVDNDGELNYIKNGHAEIDVSGWSAYADAAGVVPVDCTGGSPTETVTRTTSSPLVGTGSVLLTKDAANRQGEGISYPFTIDSAYASQSLMISLQGSGSANYASSDIGIYVYDITGTTIITPSTATLASGANNFQVTFTASANTSYRLCVHTKTTNALAYTYKLDKIFVGPFVAATSAAGAWTAYTPTFVGMGTVSNVAIFYQLIGGTMFIQGSVRTGTVQNSVPTMTLPTSPVTYKIDTTLIPASQVNKLGEYHDYSAGIFVYSTSYGGALFYNGTNTVLQFSRLYTNATSYNGEFGTAIFDSNSNINVFAMFPWTQ